MEKVNLTRKKRERINLTVSYILIIICSIFFIIPLAWMIVTALKSPQELAQGVFFPTKIRIENFAKAVKAIPFWQYTINSLYYAILGTIGATLSTTFTAYAFAKLKWPGRDKIFLVMISTLVIPAQVIQIPLFILYNKLGWMDTYNPLIIPTFFGVGAAANIFLLRQFFMGIPDSLMESAKLDGASQFAIFRTIMLPLVRSIVIVIAIMSFMGFWNDFYGPLLYISDPDYFPLAYGMRVFASQYANQYNLMMAAALIITIPSLVLFFTAQKQIIDSVSHTGMKG